MSKPAQLNLPPFDREALRKLQEAGAKWAPGPKVPQRSVVGAQAADAFFAIFGLTRVKREGEDEANGKA